MTPGDAYSYGGTPIGGGRVVIATSMQPAGAMPVSQTLSQGSAYISVQARPVTSTGSYSATPVREPVTTAYAVAPPREQLTATSTTTAAPVVVSRLVSTNSVSNLPRYPQAITGASPGQSYTSPEAYSISATSAAIAEKSAIQTFTGPITTMDMSETAKASPIWSRTFTSTAAQLPGEEAELRHAMSMQEARIMELTQQLQACQENAARLSDELEKQRGEAVRLSVELQQERFAREQAEAALQQPPQPVGSQALTPTASAAGFTKRDLVMKPTGGGAATSRTASASRRAREAKELQDRGPDAPPERPMTAAERREAAAAERRAAVAERRVAAEMAAAERRAAADAAAAERRAAVEAAAEVGQRSLSKDTGYYGRSPGTSRPASAKDEIDSRLQDYLARSQCGLIFRRLNRGFYSFRRANDNGNNDRDIEMSLVNGKLMVKMEPSAYDPGWNNGKAGPIERFCTKMAAE
mmetsp:Transcript_6944/g.16564  ORF Transcript_6944/g.16564 Transcript_6944/m.16564 type:complete len:468 (+) Transcript_6944:122-1525(+)